MSKTEGRDSFVEQVIAMGYTEDDAQYIWPLHWFLSALVERYGAQNVAEYAKALKESNQ